MRSSIGVLGIAILAMAGSPTRADLLPGMAELSGSVAGTKDMIVPVYAYNAARKVGYSVFAVNGSYRAVDLFPGRYEITVRKDGLTMEPVVVEIAAGAHATADLAPKV